MAKEKYRYGYATEKYECFKQKEKQFDLELENNCYYMIRFDGKGMTKGFKIKRQAINKTFFETMKDTFKEFCISTRNVLFGFSFSDEISIIISRNEKDNDDNRIEKLLSILSGKLALVFFE